MIETIKIEGAMIHPETGRVVGTCRVLANYHRVADSTIRNLADKGKIRKYGELWLDAWDSLVAVPERSKPGRPKAKQGGD